ncbi:hypothetical protein ACFFX0_03420 [Citricoccus parietis]|uniref:Trp operon leader peptide n=1 Tax=Citricoccus parietis TaxID=592307 RepID=A0ABV5FUG7_9MICC
MAYGGHRQPPAILGQSWVVRRLMACMPWCRWWRRANRTAACQKRGGG